MSALANKEFKQTEIGVIPEDWHCSKISEVCVTSSGTTPARSQFDRYFRNGQINWVKTLDLNNSEILKTDEQVTIEALAETSLKLYPVKTVLVAMYGGFNQIGRTGILRVPACVNQAITAIQCENQLSPEYLLATLNFRVEHWKAVASSSRKDPNITSQDVRDFQIAYPSRDEQEKIAETLSCIDSLIRSLDQLIAKKRDIQQATMQQLLTGHRRLPGFSGKWKHGVFRDVVRSLEAGVSVNSSDDLPEPGLPCVLKTSALSGGTFFPNEAKTIVAADRGRASTNPKRNTILISRMNTPALVGEIAYVGKDYDWLFLPDRLWMTRFMSDDCVNARWLAYLLSSRPYRRLLQDSATGTSGSMKNISKGVLLNLQISYPAIEEQTAIAAILSDMDTELDALEARRDKARQLKQGMMQELLTGRIRLV